MIMGAQPDAIGLMAGFDVFTLASHVEGLPVAFMEARALGIPVVVTAVGGIAFGLDRILTMMTGSESIRDVIAFPKTQRAQCLLTQAPSAVDEKQLRELNIRLRQVEAKPGVNG